MNYNKNLIDLLDEASQIQKQLIINKDANTKIIAIRANDPDVSVCYTLSAPEDYLKNAQQIQSKFYNQVRIALGKLKDHKYLSYTTLYLYESYIFYHYVLQRIH